MTDLVIWGHSREGKTPVLQPNKSGTFPPVVTGKPLSSIYHASAAQFHLIQGYDDIPYFFVYKIEFFCFSSKTISKI